MGVSQTHGYFFRDLYDKDYSIWGSELGSPYVGKLPCGHASGKPSACQVAETDFFHGTEACAGDPSKIRSPLKGLHGYRGCLGFRLRVV